MKIYLLLFGVFMYCSIGFGQVNKDVNIDFMLRGSIYAQSSIEDSLALGGFGGSDNVARNISDSLIFFESGFFIKIDTSRIGTFTKGYNGYTLFIVNKTDTIIKLPASDSRLKVLAEVYYQDTWQPIEYLPGSMCGNSYHSVYLKQNEYWSFDIPKFAGKVKVKLRYRLALSTGKFIYSNIIEAKINLGQLSKPQGHKPTGLMDPYND